MERRPLTEAERSTLAARIATARRESSAALWKTSVSAVTICGLLAALTYSASDAPLWAIACFWTGVTVILTLWISLPWHRTLRQQVAWLEEAQRANSARVIRIQSPRVVEFQEEEDEGACYAFEHGPSASIFVVGQEFYADDDFPNSDFSLIDLLGTEGNAVDTLVEKTGRKLMPERVIAASVRHMMELPEHLTVINAPLDEIEHALTHAR